MKIQEHLMQLHASGVDPIKTLEEDKKLKIGIKHYKEQGLIVLNYKIDAPKFNPIVEDCRGLILEDKPPYAVVARSFKRFYNLKEHECNGIPDISTKNLIDVTAKIDGSLITIYYWKGKWRCATRKSAFAEGAAMPAYEVFRDPYMEYKTTYAELVKQAFHGGDIDIIFQDENKNYCFIFEIVTPLNRVLTPYKYHSPTLFYLSVFDKVTGVEMPMKDDPQTEYESFRRFVYYPDIYGIVHEGILKWDNVIDRLNYLDPLEEGFVCRVRTEDNKILRIKLKNPYYLENLALINGNRSLSDLAIKMVFADAGGEKPVIRMKHLRHFPEHRKEIDKIENMFLAIVVSTREKNDRWQHRTNKDIALNESSYPGLHILFKRRKRDNKKCTWELIREMSHNHKVDLLNRFDIYFANDKGETNGNHNNERQEKNIRGRFGVAETGSGKKGNA